MLERTLSAIRCFDYASNDAGTIVKTDFPAAPAAG